MNYHPVNRTGLKSLSSRGVDAIYKGVTLMPALNYCLLEFKTILEHMSTF